MKQVMVCVIGCVLCFGCKYKEDQEDKVNQPETRTAQAATAKDKPGPEATPPTKTAPPTSASCMGALMSKKVKGAAASVELNIDGTDVPMTFRPDAVYGKNPVWDAGALPAACALVQPNNTLVWISQHSHDDKPIFRLQVLGAKGGKSEGRGGTTATGMVLLEGTSEALALSFKELNIEVSPEKLAAGPVQVKLSGKGTAVNKGNTKPFTIQAEFSGEVGTRAGPPPG